MFSLRRIPTPLLVLGFAFTATMCTSHTDDTSANDAGIGGKGGAAGSDLGDSAAGQPGDSAVGQSCTASLDCGPPPPSTCKDSATIEYYTPVCTAGRCAITSASTYCGQCSNGACSQATTTSGGFGSGGTGTAGAGAGGAVDSGSNGHVGQPCSSDVDCGYPPPSTCEGTTLEYYTPVCRSGSCALDVGTTYCYLCVNDSCIPNGTTGGTAGDGG